MNQTEKKELENNEHLEENIVKTSHPGEGHMEESSTSANSIEEKTGIPAEESPQASDVTIEESSDQSIETEESKVETPAPIEESKVEAPVEEAPVEEAPVEEAPVEEAPVEEAPVEEAPVEEAPVEEAPAPIEESKVEAPVEETSAPIEESKVETPAEETSAPIEESKVETPAEETSAPIEESKVEAPAGAEESKVENPKENAPADTETRHKGKKVQHNPVQEEFDALLLKIKSEESYDEKLRLAVDNMEVYLSQGGTPLFKYFWELRKLCLEYFKESISPPVRASLWPKYSNLSKEARRLKEIFDEQSAFAVEQIDIAIVALEKEITNFDDSVGSQSDVEFPFKSKFLDRKKSVYNDIQKRLNLLNAYATRINNLRKELMKTDMRIKHKNKFFQRLSVTGDQVFPLRKDLIKKISDQFLSDVESFLVMNFSGDQIDGPVFYLREEIKVLQSVAKILTLNTHSFTSTRIRLSECWDKLKVVDKERKKEYAEKKDVFLQNKAEVDEKLQALSEKFTNENLSTGAALKELDAIQVFMRQIDLGRDEVKSLRQSVSDVRALIQVKKKAEEDARIQEEREKVRIRKEKLETVKIEIQDILGNAGNLIVDEVEIKHQELTEKISQFKDISGREKLDLDRALRNLKDLLSAKKEEALLNLSDDDQHALKNLREVLAQRRSRRKEVKEQYDSLRKASRSSGLDFEQAMLHNDQVNAEKERLDQSDAGIQEIEKKIREIKSKI
jgi:hypothetical protein